jgi:hypothetical protein
VQKITTFLWFDGNAEQAADFYVSIFKNSKVLSTMGPKGNAMGVTFQLEGQEFIGLNGGPKYKFTPAISLFVSCETQAEVDELWGSSPTVITSSAVGSRTNTACPGRSFPRSWASCSGQGPGEGRPGDAGDAADEEDRYRKLKQAFDGVMPTA